MDNKNQSESISNQCCASPYAERKRKEELLFKTYSEEHAVSSTALRLFSVYGPFGNPLMATFQFINRIVNDEDIDIYSNTESRDWIYILDAVSAIQAIAQRRLNIASPKFDVFNIGTGRSVAVSELVSKIESISKRTAKKNLRRSESNRMLETRANTKKTDAYTGIRPKFSLEMGLAQTIAWHVSLLSTGELYEIVQLFQNTL